MVLERQLDEFEIITLGDSPTLYTEYYGRIEEPVLGRASKILGKTFPLLRARVRREGEDYILSSSDDNEFELDAVDGDKQTLLRWATEPWNPESGVARLSLIRGDREGFVAMRVDHSVMDGHSFYFMFSELWSIYTDLSNGQAPVTTRNERLPRSHDDIISERFSEWKFGNTSGSVVGKRLTLDDLVLYDVIQRDTTFLDKDGTAKLIATARQRGTTVHGLLCGAVLVAQFRQARFNEPTRMTCLSPVDLRSRVNPPIHWTETTNLMVSHQANIVVSMNDDPIAVGERVSEQLDAALNRKELSNAILQSSAQDEREHLRTAAVSNIGDLGEFKSPEGLVVSALRGIATKIPYPTYGVWTSQGELGMLALFPSGAVSVQMVDGVLRWVKKNLHGIANS